jgi:hypothetical protein
MLTRQEIAQAIEILVDQDANQGVFMRRENSDAALQLFESPAGERLLTGQAVGVVNSVLTGMEPLRQVRGRRITAALLALGIQIGARAAAIAQRRKSVA